MLLLDIKEHQIKALSKVGLNLSHFWVLNYLNYQSTFDVVTTIPEVKEVKLLKDRYLIDSNGITTAGTQFYNDIVACKAETKKKAVEEKGDEDGEDNGFELWWKTYPASGNFEYKGMKFTSGRALKSNKQVCEMLYDKAVAISGATPGQLLKALSAQITLIKKESYESGKNGLQYMSSAEVYLRQGKYEAFLQQVAGSADDYGKEEEEEEYQNNSA